MGEHLRAALRAVAIDGPAALAREAARHLDAPSSPVVASILRTAATDPLIEWSSADRRTVVLGSLEALAEVRDGSPEWSARLTSVLETGRAAGISLRELGSAAGISHTAVLKRLGR